MLNLVSEASEDKFSLIFTNTIWSLKVKRSCIRTDNLTHGYRLITFRLLRVNLLVQGNAQKSLYCDLLCRIEIIVVQEDEGLPQPVLHLIYVHVHIYVKPNFFLK